MPGELFPHSGQIRLVAVVFGGPAGEHEVSCASAAAIVSHLDPRRYLVRLVYLTEDGEWMVGPCTVPAGPAAAQQLRELTQHMDAKATRQPPMDALAEADVVMPALHGPFGEDGTAQALLDSIRVPYVGCGMAASVQAFDKDVAKRVLASYGIPVAPWVTLRHQGDRPSADDRARLGLPVFVKPARAGSSVGISKVTAWDELDAAVVGALKWDTKVLVEQAVRGREIDLAVLEHADGKIEAGPALEIHYGPKRAFFDYDAKYRDSGTEFVIPAPLEQGTRSELGDLALRVFTLLGCRGLARIDFILDGRRPVFNELNTFPGFTQASQYPRIWAARGMGLGELLDRLIDTALVRTQPGG